MPPLLPFHPPQFVGWPLAVTVVASVLGLSLCLGVLFWIKLRFKRAAVMRRIMPPLGGPETSLVVTGSLGLLLCFMNGM